MNSIGMSLHIVDIVVLVFMVLGAVGTALTTAQVLLAAGFLFRRSGRALATARGRGASGTEESGQRREDKKGRPVVTIIKPVSGIEDGLEMNLESFAHLEGPSYELIISVADPDDPALPIIDKVLPLFAKGMVRVVIGGAIRMDNPKVERLAAAARHATGELLLISDSNVRVSNDYLAATLAEFDDPRVGCAVNLFVGDGAASLGAALECLYIMTFVVPGTILAACAGVTCVVGKSMAISSRVLQEIGGFEAFAQVLAEDQSIGLAVARAGYRVALSPVLVHNVVQSRAISGAVKRQVRWGKMRYSFSRFRYTGEFLCNPLPLLLVASTLSAVAGLSPVSECALLTGSAVAARILQAGALIHLTRAKLPRLSLLLVPVQDCIQAATQLVPYFSHQIDWRGFRTRLGRGTQILEPRRAANSGT